MNDKDIRKAAEIIRLSDEKKQQIIDECVKNIDNTELNGEQVSGVERVKSRPVMRFAAMAAACAVIIGGVGTTMHFMSRNGTAPAQSSEVETHVVMMPFGDFVDMYYWFIGGRSENPDDRLVVGEYLNTVEWRSTELADINTHADDIPEYIIDINEDDRHKLIMIYDDGVAACGELSPDFDFAPEVVFTQKVFEDAPVTYYKIHYPSFDEQMLAFEQERNIKIKNSNGTLVPVEDIEMLDVTNMQYELAMDQLMQSGFERVEYKKQQSDEIPEGYVISSDPKPGEVVPSDTNIMLYVSCGVTDDIKVESYIGLTVDDASAMAEYYGLKVRTLDNGGDDANRTVTAQSIEAGSVVPVGTEITLTVGMVNDLDLDFDLPYENVRFVNYKNTECPFILSKEQRDKLVSAIELGCYESVSSEEINGMVNNVAPEEQLGFGAYCLDWNDGNSWGELTVFDNGIVSYNREIVGGEQKLEWYRIDASYIDTKIRSILGWSEGYCPFGTPYKTGLSYNGEALTGSKLREVSNAFFGWDWSKAEAVDSFLGETPTYKFTYGAADIGDVVINVYSDGTIEWSIPDSGVYRLTDADGDASNANIDLINQILDDILK